MVSFSCEVCNDVFVKKKLDAHRNQCRNAVFTCLDCSTTFEGTSYRSHTTCLSEAQKYQKSLYTPSKGKNVQNRNQNQHDGNHVNKTQNGNWTNTKNKKSRHFDGQDNPNLTPLGDRRNGSSNSCEQVPEINLKSKPEVTNASTTITTAEKKEEVVSQLSYSNGSKKRKHEEEFPPVTSKAKENTSSTDSSSRKKQISSEPISREPESSSQPSESVRKHLEKSLSSISTKKSVKISKLLKELKKAGVKEDQALEALKGIKLRRNDAGEILLVL